MKCQDFREIIDSYLCDELLTETNHEVLRHLEACANCRGVIESRRILRTRMKSAVKNSPQFQIRDGFYNSLCAQLKQSAIAAESPKNLFWTRDLSWMALAASLIITFGLGFWFFQTQPENLSPIDVAQINNEAQKVSLADFAVGDHQNCAVKYNLAEEPVEINLASAQYADLRQAVLTPLQNAAQYEFLESHTCKYQGRNFTHLVFRHQGKTVSILLTDLQNYPALKNDEVAKIASNGYQIARFDVKNKAVFVVSDLSEQENSATAKILENPLKQQFSASEHTRTTSFSKINYPVFQTTFISR
ncbi:MAG: zf-HC2 domain-containing protein [Acidobacteria bacterium]|nr:zf-HC2 domain-containing protein [Acidobacteriota bacterium]